MKRTIALSLLLIIAFSCVTLSCKRKENIQTRLTRLMNKWKLIKIANDSNGNGAIDVSEIHAVQEGYDDILLFSQDYTGSETVNANGVVTVYPFVWSTDPKQDSITRDGVGHNMIKYYLHNISSINMELRTNTTLGIAAYYYEVR